MVLLITHLPEGYLVKAGDESLLVTAGSVTRVDQEKLSFHYTFSQIEGLVGIISLKSNKYLITIDSCVETGNINSHKVYQMKKFSVLPIGVFNHNEEDRIHLSLINQHLTDATLFFSHSYDLTNSLQRQSQNAIQGVDLSKIDTRFFWNHYLSQEFLAFPEFVTPLIYGYAKIIQTSILGQPLSFGLITRRSRFRAGTRYFRRGIDKDGNVANFNETEQLMTSNGKIFSYLQTRGSVPTYWGEINNLRYKPNLVINDASSIQASEKHFNEQIELYGKNYLVNLVNQKGYEQPVKESYERCVEALNKPDLINYIYFDFHHECRNMRWGRVQLLIEKLQSLGYSDEDYFTTTASLVESLQKSVVRTNCMDCLDRTNVVQSTLALWILKNQLQKIGINSIDANFQFQFQNLWADNADFVSKLYSGTGALKTDFTRLGKRTRLGALKDLQNSIVRYLKNNYYDGLRQDSFDLFLGIYQPVGLQNPFTDTRDVVIQSLPTIMWSSFGVLLCSLLYPSKTPSNWFINIMALSVLLGSLNFITKNPQYYVNWPKLLPVHTYVKQSLSTSKKD